MGKSLIGGTKSDLLKGVAVRLVKGLAWAYMSFDVACFIQGIGKKILMWYCFVYVVLENHLCNGIKIGATLYLLIVLLVSILVQCWFLGV